MSAVIHDDNRREPHTDLLHEPHTDLFNEPFMGLDAKPRLFTSLLVVVDQILIFHLEIQSIDLKLEGD